MGVQVALEMYRQFPDRVSAMVLTNGTNGKPLDQLFGSRGARVIHGGLRAVGKDRVRLLKPLGNAREVEQRARADVRAMGEAEKQQRPLAGQPVEAEISAVLIGQRERRNAAGLRQNQQRLQIRLLPQFQHPLEGGLLQKIDPRLPLQSSCLLPN